MGLGTRYFVKAHFVLQQQFFKVQSNFDTDVNITFGNEEFLTPSIVTRGNYAVQLRRADASRNYAAQLRRAIRRIEGFIDDFSWLASEHTSHHIITYFI